MIISSIVFIFILFGVIAITLRQPKFRPIDFARFRIVEAGVVGLDESRAVVFTQQKHLLKLKHHFLQLKKMSTDFSRNNTGGFMMTVYFEDHDHVDVFFLDNVESGKIITLSNQGYYNDEFWSYMDSVFRMPTVNENQQK